MRVLIVTEIYPPDCSGGGWSTYNLAKALHETEEVDVKVLAVNQDSVKEDVPVEKIEVKRFPNELAYRQIRKEISERKDDFDVIQGQHSLTIPPLGMIDDKTTVGVIRDYWPICYRTTLRDRFGNNHLKCGLKCATSTVMDFHFFSPYKFFNHYYRQKLTRNVDMLAPRSKFVEERLNEHGFEDTEVMYNFVPDYFAEGVEPEGKGDILFVGKLEKQKGPQLLVEAIPDILEERTDQKFVFLGEGSLREELEQRIREMGLKDQVEFRGYVSMEEVKSRMKGARSVVSPSLWHEPLSRVVIESQALETPVITTDRGGNGEATEESIEPEGIKENLIAFLNKENLEVGEPFRKNDIIEDWKQLYTRLTDETEN